MQQETAIQQQRLLALCLCLLMAALPTLGPAGELSAEQVREKLAPATAAPTDRESKGAT